MTRLPATRSCAGSEYSQTTPNFHVGGIVKGGCRTELPDEVIAAYDAPFPDDSYKAGARQVSRAGADLARRSRGGVRTRRRGPCSRSGRSRASRAFSDQDPITRGADRAFQSRVPGAKGQPHTTIEGGGHFLQEDKGEELAKVIVSWLAGT